MHKMLDHYLGEMFYLVHFYVRKIIQPLKSCVSGSSSKTLFFFFGRWYQYPQAVNVKDFSETHKSLLSLSLSLCLICILLILKAERERSSMYLLAYSPDGCNSQAYSPKLAFFYRNLRFLFMRCILGQSTIKLEYKMSLLCFLPL